ncbi:MAG: energy-coupling factor transporter transmembrane component T [Promethearchaeia archaeon]
MSLDFFNAFQFFEKDTIIHRLDPRTKLILSIIYSISALLYVNLIPLLLLLLSLLPFIFFGKIFKQWFKSIRGLSFLYLIILILNTFFLSFSMAIAMIIRITIMISAFSIFFLTVHPNDLALSLISMGMPYEFAFSFSLSFRFVPTIARETQNIMDAQQSRGYEMQKKGLINQIKNLFPLLIPLIVCSIKRAFKVAEALESRSFGSQKERTFYYRIDFTTKDWVLTFYLLALISILIYLKIQFSIMPGWFQWSLPI